MGDYNSLVPAFAGILASLIKRDLSRLWSSDKNMEKDLTVVKQRASAEGISFLTKTLPSLGKAFDKALSLGIPFEAPKGFKTLESSKLPRFLGDLFRNVLNDEGELLPAPNHRSVAGIRQLAYMFYKLKLPYKDNETKRVSDGFVAVESELALQGDPDCTSDRVLFCSRRLIASVCCNIDPAEILPRHGPGSVATGECARGKSKFGRIYSSLEAQYPFTEYFQWGAQQVADELHEIQELECLPSPTAKIVFVPKDSRGPRIISEEPLEVQWIQQGLRSVLYSAVEQHPLTRGHVNFTDQTINRQLALKSSLSGRHATIDMKDASDRVSLKLVKCLFEHTALLDALLATRSHATLLPDGRIIPLNKFAPMGSALCFPVEALVFWSIAVSVLHIVCGYRLKDALAEVYVYGDDIVCPVREWTTVAAAYSALNLEVNTSKCCVDPRGIFRESCGLDAFLGHDVTPIRIKQLPTSPLVEWVPSYVAQSNRAYALGYHALADILQKIVEERVRDIPVTSSNQLQIAFVRPYASNKICPAKKRYNASLQRMEVKGYVVRTTRKSPSYDGYKRILRHV
jgi:hypothetical protein